MAVVIDPIQSVKGKVVIDAFRLINPQLLMMGFEPRQTTANVGHLNKPSIQVSPGKSSASPCFGASCLLWCLVFRSLRFDAAAPEGKAVRSPCVSGEFREWG